MKVIVADDSLITRRGLSRDLEALGCEVVAKCSTPEEAVAACASLKPDILLLDMVMGGGQLCDGRAAAEIVLRERTAGHVVAVTSMLARSPLKTLTESGMRVIHKPASKDKLVTMLEKIEAEMKEKQSNGQQ